MDLSVLVYGNFTLANLPYNPRNKYAHQCKQMLISQINIPALSQSAKNQLIADSPKRIKRIENIEQRDCGIVDLAIIE